MSELDNFRRETRAWLEDNCPAGARGPGPIPIGSTKVALSDDSRIWLERMIAKGWTVPTWPKQYGGAELSKAEYGVLIEELSRINARSPLTGRGVNYIGPTILELGTDEQKSRWLPMCARGEGAWAMGYSEPGAGSDLASLATKAVLDGDRYLVNGSKIWTSDATECDYIFALVRTAPEKPKHEGISLVLIDMDQPGVSVSPIRLLSGKSPFCETHFDNAVVPADDVIGGVDNGWTVGKRLLQFERSTHAGINTSGSQGGREVSSPVRGILERYVGIDNGRLADTGLRKRYLEHSINVDAQRLTQRRAIEESQARAPGFTSSAVKLTNALNLQEADELMMAAMGTTGMTLTDDSEDQHRIAAMTRWLYQKSLTIAGGTKEIQLNIIAKRVLGLPD
ncbi:MAG: acyl-CoA dehydrogenase family protein [Pseudomonadaceae bacterium]|nr:acyl-CoA dehydrogenase family protein [Pseudomonadaceae bacterium]